MKQPQSKSTRVKKMNEASTQMKPHATQSRPISMMKQPQSKSTRVDTRMKPKSKSIRQKKKNGENLGWGKICPRLRLLE